MNRIFVVLAVIVLAVSPVALARTWTDNQGNKMTAKFVRVHQGKVVLSRAGGVITVPFSNFSPADQDYIRKELEAAGEGHLVPPRTRGQGSVDGLTPALKPVESSAPEGDPTSNANPDQTPAGPGAARTWTDVQGRTIEAQFVGVSGDKVELLKGGKKVSYPFVGFSAADQQYVQTELEARGQGHLAAGLQDGPGLANDPMQMPGRSSALTSPGRRPPSMPAMPNSGSPSFPGPQSYRPPGMSTPPMPSTPGPAQTSPDIPMSPVTPDLDVEVGVCGNCEKEVPAHLGAGDRCPHCGVLWDFEETADGRMVDAKGKEVSGTCGKAAGAGGILILAVAVLIAVFRLYLLFGRRH